LAQIELTDSETEKQLFLKLEAKGKIYNFYYGTIPGEWKEVKGSVDGKALSTEVAGGFVGVIIGMYASSQGHPSSNFADFDWFEYSGNDIIFNRK